MSTSGFAGSPARRMPSGLRIAVTTTISFAENTTYHEAASPPELPKGLLIRSSSMMEGEEGTNTQHALPSRIHSAS